MSEEHGPNVRKLNWLGSHGGPASRLSQQPDGTRAAVPADGPESDEEISRGGTPEEAAGARILLLEEQGVYVPEPPDDYLRPGPLDGP
jgi:hypothetical protein